MATEFTYSISADMPDGAVDNTALMGEISASSIVPALKYISIDGDELKIVFATDLSAGEETILDGDTTGPAGGLLAAHNKDMRILSEPTKSIARRITSKDSSSLTYSTYCSLRIDDLMEGTYKVSWYAEFGGRNANAVYHFRVHYPQGPTDLSEVSIRPGLANTLTPMSGWYILENLSRDVMEICIQMKVDDNKTSGFMQNARVIVEPVDIIDDSDNPAIVSIPR